MKVAFILLLAASTVNAVPLVRRQLGSFPSGQPYDPATGKGASILGGTDPQLDVANPDGLGQQSTDAGTVPNLKWPFSLSKTKIFPGGWTRTQDINDLPQSKDIAAAQQHLRRGALRELHWHKVAEWGFVYSGSVLISAVDADGNYQLQQLGFGDIWYFPKGVAHTIQGLEDDNEYLLTFDDGDFNAVGVTFMVDDWLAHTPKSVIAKNFGLNETVFKNLPTTDPYILNGTITNSSVSGINPQLSGNSSFVYRTLQHPSESVPGNGGTFYKIDSTNFPISKTIAATYVTLKPGGLRELHWHPNAEEWLYFHQGQGRATVFIGNANARTFDFGPGDTAVFPDNSGHYIENTSPTDDLVWIEIYKSDRVQDISLTQWLALTPADIVANTLRIDLSVAQGLKKEKQLLIAANTTSA
ncbi:Oxalate decarboxylase OxdC [Cladophialophora carrionii]|uniref:Oxalate decarboxylase OxdC n=1 Tax=Cladophialophora carrionii TaxID=86049 RepID=A0A1C1CKI4_9EURO|nr:Oxalate decarboxylase OxdC [Cladophialophora carrionii]